MNILILILGLSLIFLALISDYLLYNLFNSNQHCVYVIFDLNFV